MTQDLLDRCEKNLRHHLRAFHRALGKLEELQLRRKAVETGKLVVPPSPLSTESACEAYLADRFRAGKCACPRCGAQQGHHISSRRCWQCSACGCQTGLRHGTIMADSQIPLATWFMAIWLLLWRPAITAVELAFALGIHRVLTVRKMAIKIRAALAAENAGVLLAGLDAYYATCLTAVPESGARLNKNSQTSEARHC